MNSAEHETISLDDVRTWLENDRSSSLRWALTEAVSCSIGGVLVTFLTFVFVYASLWSLCWMLSLPTGVAMAFALLFVPLVFLGHARRKDDPSPSYLQRLLSVFYWGPVLFQSALLALRKRRRGRELDADRCAAVLHHVVSRGGRVPFRELGKAFPDGLRETLLQLKDVDGVLFELYNLANHAGFRAVHQAAINGTLDRKEYIEGNARLEYEAVRLTARFYERAWRPWAIHRDFWPRARRWSYPAPDSYERWIRGYTTSSSSSGYPWRSYGRDYDTKIVPYLESRGLK
jgi:hypothetical protein